MKRLLLIFWIVLSTYSIAQNINITTQPVSFSQCVGGSANIFINAEATTSAKLNFQWFKDGERISGEVSPVLSFPSLQHYQSGLYTCRVTLEDGSESVDSRSASVYVLRPTSISKEPVDVKSNTVDGNVFLNFEAHINGISVDEAIKNGEYVSIQWYRVNDNNNLILHNDEIFNGVNSSQLSINMKDLPDTTFYFAEIEGKCGNALTRTVMVINNLSIIKLKIPDLEACEGNIESINAQITNPHNHKLEFQWYKDGKPIYYKENLKGLFSDELIFNPIYIKDSGKYKLEAKINGMNYSAFSNDIDVKVGKMPNIVCFRADTLRFNSDILDKEQKRDYVTGWTKDVRLVIFYEYSTVPFQFDIYRDEVLISTQLSDESVWHLGDIYYLNFDVDRNDEAKYWVIAHNHCGSVFSDTVTIKTENLCDPYNQKQHICEGDRMYFQVDYINKIKDIELDYFWFTLYKNGGFGGEFKAPFSAGGLIREKNYLFSQNFLERFQGNHHFNYNKLQRGLKIRNRDSTKGWESIFCCLDIYFDYVPILRRGPENRIVNYGEVDTLFNVSFNNDAPFNLDIDISIYFMKDLKSEPRMILTTMPTYGIYYYHIKEVNWSDDGYYFALAKHHENDCIISTDTIKVTVMPKSSTTSVSELDSNSGLNIHPNPASDFITIQFSNKGLQLFAESVNVQIFDVLGIEVMSVGTGLDLSTQKIDISHLPSGVYFIRFGDKVEKFVKM